MGWCVAKAFANWILPDVPGDAVSRIGRTQNAIVVFKLPEAAMRATCKLDASFLLEA